jgi:hypothetical protein
MLAIVFSFEFCEKIHSGVPAEGFGIMPADLLSAALSGRKLSAIS